MVSTHESYVMADRPADELSRGEAASDHVGVANADPLLDRVQPPPEGADIRFVTYAQLRVITGFSADFFRKAVRDGDLTPYGPPNGSRVVFLVSEVVAYLHRPKVCREPARAGSYQLPPGLPGSSVHWEPA